MHRALRGIRCSAGCKHSEFFDLEGPIYRWACTSAYQPLVPSNYYWTCLLPLIYSCAACFLAAQCASRHLLLVPSRRESHVQRYQWSRRANRMSSNTQAAQQIACLAIHRHMSSNTQAAQRACELGYSYGLRLFWVTSHDRQIDSHTTIWLCQPDVDRQLR